VAHPNGDLGLPRLHERLRHWARVRPSHPAVKSTTGVLTFAQMRDAVDAAADTLQRSGVSAGGVVAFQLPNWTDAFVLYHAILSIDAIALPLLPALRDRDLAYMLRETQACLFITPVVWRGHDHQAMARRVCSTQVRVAVVRAPHEDLPLLHDWSWGQAEVHQPARVRPASRGGAPGSPTAVCSMIFTSGTSGRPKAVLYSHQCLAFEGRDMAGVDCVEAEDVLFVPSSIGHVSGLSFGIYLPMHVGATVCLLAEWNAAQAVENARNAPGPPGRRRSFRASSPRQRCGRAPWPAFAPFAAGVPRCHRAWFVKHARWGSMPIAPTACLNTPRSAATRANPSLFARLPMAPCTH